MSEQQNDFNGPLKPEVLALMESLNAEADGYCAKRHPEDSLAVRYAASIQALLIRLHNKLDAREAASNHSLLSAAAPELKAELAVTDPLCQQLATVAMHPEVERYLPFGLLDEVKAWLANSRGQAVIKKAEGK